MGMAAPLVAAAGTAAGGAAGSALMGDTSYPKGGGIPGLTSTDTGKSGISPTVQIDPSYAIDYFKQAATAGTSNYQTGLNFYSDYIGKATQQLQQGVAQANQTLGPLSQAGSTSTNQYLKMLGLDAPSATSSLSSQAGGLGSSYLGVAQEMAKAEALKDPAQRDAAKAKIMTGLGTAQTAQLKTLQEQKAAAIGQIGGQSAADLIQGNQRLASMYSLTGQGKDPSAWLQSMQALPEATAALKQLNQNTAAASKIGQEFDAQIKTFQDQSKALSDQFGAGYGSENTSGGYNAQQIAAQQAAANPQIGRLQADQRKLQDQQTAYINQLQNQQTTLTGKMEQQIIPGLVKPTAETLQNTPGYQFSLEQGQKSLMRAAAAGGMLSTGNTLAAMDKYSQGLAQQVYQQEYTNYLNSVNTNNNIYGNIGSIQNATGNTVSGIYANQASQNQGLAELTTAANNAYMQNLQFAMGQGNQATGQIAANQLGLGSASAALSQSLGQAGMQSYQGIGNMLAQLLTHSGDTITQSNLANMQAQNNAIQNANNLTAQTGIQGGYLSLANQKYGNELAQQGGYASGLLNSLAGNFTNTGAYSVPSRWTLG